MNHYRQDIQRMVCAMLSGLCFVLGCTDCRQFGQKLNPCRVKRGIPVIENNWTVQYADNSEALWVSPITNESIARHAGKKLFYSGKALLSEEDYYYSGAKFVPKWDPDGSVSEKITINCEYKGDSTLWTCSWINSNSIDRMTIDEAERILKSWGIDRLHGANPEGTNKPPATPDQPSR